MKKEIKILAILVVIVILVLFGIKGYTFFINQQEVKKENAEQQVSMLTTLQNKINDLENKPEPVPQVITKTVTIDNTKKLSGYTTEEVIKQWQPKTAYIICFWYSSDDTTYSNPYQIASGSGMLTSFDDGTVKVVTNKHVVSDDNGYNPNGCFIKVPDFEKIFVTTKNIEVYTDRDLSLITIPEPSPSLIKISKNTPDCGANVNLGEKIVVLGYPSNGGDGITATEGIISGTDGDYYTTSAKIEHGNSGGLAISTEHNCFVGIPTAVVVGSMESLGRILKNTFVFKN